jgi:hypothetical protein
MELRPSLRGSPRRCGAVIPWRVPPSLRSGQASAGNARGALRAPPSRTPCARGNLSFPWTPSDTTFCSLEGLSSAQTSPALTGTRGGSRLLCPEMTTHDVLGGHPGYVPGMEAESQIQCAAQGGVIGQLEEWMTAQTVPNIDRGASPHPVRFDNRRHVGLNCAQSTSPLRRETQRIRRLQ